VICDEISWGIMMAVRWFLMRYHRKVQRASWHHSEYLVRKTISRDLVDGVLRRLTVFHELWWSVSWCIVRCGWNLMRYQYISRPIPLRLLDFVHELSWYVVRYHESSKWPNNVSHCFALVANELRVISDRFLLWWTAFILWESFLILTDHNSENNSPASAHAGVTFMSRWQTPFEWQCLIVFSSCPK